ncbi:hypothetical protein MKU92_004735 [Salmonella enterica]|nr:hypothetical protein [Salmonella enterica]
MLDQLNGFGSQTITSKAFGNQDLAALSAATGDEFAMFTTGGRRLIIRGNATSVPIDVVKAQELSAQGWRWSSHVHPDGSTMSSPGDRAVLDAMGGNEVQYLIQKGKEGFLHLMEIALKGGHHDYARQKEATSRF